MASLTCLQLNINKELLKGQLHESRFSRVRMLGSRKPSICMSRFKNLPLLCTKNLAWESSLPYASTEDGDIIKGSNTVEPIDAEEPPEVPFLQSENDVIELKNQPSMLLQPLKWPMWLLGPSVLLVTGAIPTLWLPLSSVFLGPNIAGLLSLVGLDCIFNMGAMLFLLMADACGRPKESSSVRVSHIPSAYKLWNLGASLLGFLIPLVLLFASYKGTLQPHLPSISSAVLLGPYLLLLSIQVLIEMLTWHWKSPVWLVAPVVYEAYRVLQLMRGLTLATEVGSPAWMVEGLRGLVSWWVLVLAIQLMRIAWFAGFTSLDKQ
ncbi:uncharacterized protein [Typha angustifolia]|uniref:uncharacterized protein n=1 Tax=Typha angustifolia TaxID=59011 RepID=UPI003C2E6874